MSDRHSTPADGHDLTVVILTLNESIHIQRCLDSVAALGAAVVVVDAFSTDDTCKLAADRGATVYQNVFVHQAQQFQWAMDNANIGTEWILRLDADETIDAELVKNITEFVAQDGQGHEGAVLHRKQIFLGKWIKHGGRYPVPILRLFRRGSAHIEQRWMDEHLVLDHGTSIVLKGGFEDNNLNRVSWFIDKHNVYASREMVDIMLAKLDPSLRAEVTPATGFSIRVKRLVKNRVYLRLPYFVRPFLYFCYRYFLQLGFLDGARGFAYHFMQGYWYRTLVDLKCVEVERAWASCASNEEKLEVLSSLSGLDLDHARD